MKLAKFRFGGVHPHDSKNTANIVSSNMENPPKSVLISMAQHIGAPAKLLKIKAIRLKEENL